MHAISFATCLSTIAVKRFQFYSKRRPSLERQFQISTDVNESMNQTINQSINLLHYSDVTKAIRGR